MSDLVVELVSYATVAAIAAIAFLWGRKRGRDIYQEKAQDIQEKRERAYEKIDARATDRAMVADRLRQGDY